MPRWLLYAILAVLSWGVWAILSRFIGDNLSPMQSQALSTLGILPVMIALACSRRLTSSGNRRRGIVAAFLAGLLGCGGNIAYYYVLNMGEKASTVIPLTALYPLITIVLAVLLLRERINLVQGAGIGLSLAAIYLFNITSVKGVFSGWMVYALVPILFWGVAGLVQKISTNHVSGELSTLWFHAAFLPVAVVLMIAQPLQAQPAFRNWMFVILLGLFFSLGNLAILAAFASGGKASIVAPLTALYPVVSIPLAILFFSEKIGPRESAAIVLALGSVAALAWERPPKTILTTEKSLNEIHQ
jgi:uncharacterized membrane protein